MSGKVRPANRFMPRIDVSVQNEGSVILLTPNTEAARDWIDENISSSSTWWGKALVVETRYAGPVIEGMQRAGLVVG